MFLALLRDADVVAQERGARDDGKMVTVALNELNRESLRTRAHARRCCWHACDADANVPGAGADSARLSNCS